MYIYLNKRVELAQQPLYKMYVWIIIIIIIMINIHTLEECQADFPREHTILFKTSFSPLPALVRGEWWKCHLCLHGAPLLSQRHVHGKDPTRRKSSLASLSLSWQMWFVSLSCSQYYLYWSWKLSFCWIFPGYFSFLSPTNNCDVVWTNLILLGRIFIRPQPSFVASVPNVTR